MRAERYRHIRGSVSTINYHFVWCPKYRRKVLIGAVAERLKELLQEKAAELHCTIKALEVMLDHLHVFVDCPPTLPPQQLANQFKGYTSRVLRDKFPHLCSRLPSLWSRSYYVGSAGHVSTETIQNYIEQQKRSYMKLTVQLKLKPTSEQAEALKRTLETANAACDYISQVAWEARTFGQFAIHRLTYGAVRDTFGLSAQLTVRCIAKVADAYKLDKKSQRTFAPLGAVAFDERILAYKSASVSIWTLDGRQAIPIVCGERQKALLAFRRGESDLAFVRGQWYLFATAETPTPDPLDVDDVLGIDLGVTNIAVDSDGVVHSGKAIKNVRYRHRRLRNKLQRLGTLGSRRRLRILAGQEARFAKHVNHVISKGIVAKSKCTKRAIAVEDLTHIRTRIKARRTQRATLHSWGFAQLQAFIAYKAVGAGVPVHRVDPRNTSRTCPKCGCIDKTNRKTQASFVCISCGFAGHADMIAAENIRVLGRAAVNPPHCSDADGSVAPEQSPRL